MKDSHGQTAQPEDDGECPKCWLLRNHEGACDLGPPTIVQDYREYTAEEILREIVKFTEQAGWGDPANLGHWLGAAQRWARKEEVKCR